jgi:hypothetical protein
MILEMVAITQLHNFDSLIISFSHIFNELLFGKIIKISVL